VRVHATEGSRFSLFTYFSSRARIRFHDETHLCLLCPYFGAFLLRRAQAKRAWVPVL
jgi:hypothetical protein